MITLGIETSCDETAAAVLDGDAVLASEVSSSVHLHRKYGGVVPEIASRYHLEYIHAVAEAAFNKSGVGPADLDLVAATAGPGLCGSLLTGLSFAKMLAYAARKPFIGVNHIIAHMYANFFSGEHDVKPSYPFIGLVISGGHTSLFLCKSPLKSEHIGRTQDDAVGEAFDKVAKILGLGYPGGPAVEKAAAKFKADKPGIEFPRAYINKHTLDFSFSGVKTAVLYYVKKRKITPRTVSAVSYAFQQAVFEVICAKAVSACRRHGVSELVVGGGVACNRTFREMMARLCGENGVRLFVPGRRYCLDNAAMAAYLGSALYKSGRRSDFALTANPNMEEVTC